MKRTKSSLARRKYITASSTENRCMWEKAEPDKSVEQIYGTESSIAEFNKKKKSMGVDRKLMLKSFG